jgi:hypothetical protein
MPPYHIIRIERAVGEGVSGALWASVGAVLKRDSAEDPYCVANELICGALGQFLGLPVPPCGLFVEPGAARSYFGTLNFNVRGDSFPPADVAECLDAYRVLGPRPDHVIGTLVFDVWVANGDRNERNLRLDTTANPRQLHVFDHGWALFGRGLRGAESAPGVPRLRRLRDELGIADSTDPSGVPHCLLTAVRSNERFGGWIERVRAVPNFVIDDAVRRAREVQLVTPAEATEVVNFLRHRRDALADIIQAHRARFSGISDANWGPL